MDLVIPVCYSQAIKTEQLLRAGSFFARKTRISTLYGFKLTVETK